jgi:hypothetical protein
MTTLTQGHSEKETLSVDINIPTHTARGNATPLFSKSRLQLIDREAGKCWVCQQTKEQVGSLEAHHHPIERCFAEGLDWDRFKADALNGVWGQRVEQFDWASFSKDDPYKFVDDMTVNGLLLCKQHHTHLDSGVHTLPYPMWIAQKYLPTGYQYNKDEVIVHGAV